LLRGFGRRRHAEQAGGAGIPWGAAWRLSVTVLADILAWCATRGHGGAGGLADAARIRRAVPAGVAGAVLDRIRTGIDQTATLRPAALPCDRHPDRRRAGTAGIIAIMAAARSRV